MNAVPPNTGASETVVARDQPEYIAYPAALYKTEEGRLVVLSRWKLTEEEKLMILNGEDFYIGLMTDGGPVQPMYLQVGPQGWLQDTISQYVCPTCHEEFLDMDACVAHVRDSHKTPHTQELKT